MTDSTEEDRTYALSQLPAAAGLSQLCSEAHLAEIATWVTDWRAVSPFLGLTEAEEIAILGSNPHSVCAQKIAMLRKWKLKQGPKATYKRLCRVFVKCGSNDLEKKIAELLTESGSSSDEEDSLSNPSHCASLVSYSNYLRQLYTSMSHSHTSQHWTHLPQCEFIKLAMIGEKGLRRGGPEEEMIRLAQQGKIETILSCKKSIDLHDIIPSPQPLIVLPPPPQLPRICLIEGAPGGGKSTLALHICHQWAQGASWLARFDVVVLAYLRDEAVQNATTLSDILPSRKLREKFESIDSQLQATNGKNVLFIFDGWDEFPHKLMINSLVSTILRQPHELSLHQSTVLITSRPVSSGNIIHIADQRVEILGFAQYQIYEYIERALDGNNTCIEKLVQHVKDHPVIEGYCYVPLHVAILVHIFLTMKGALPTTLHELFCSLVLCCIVREQATHKHDACLPDFSSFDNLPDDIKFKLNNLSLLAYNGVMHNKVVFYSKDLRSSNLPHDLPSLGLLQAVEGLTLYSKSLSYNFLHLSVQELLAAYRISQMNSSKQLRVFKEFFTSKSPRFQSVLHYYCGFTKLENVEIQKFVSSFQHDKSHFQELLPLLHCFFEAQQPSLSQLVDPKFLPCANEKLNSGVLVPVDFLSIGYFLATFLSTSLNAPNLHLSIGNIDDHFLNLLLSELSKYPISPIICESGKLILEFYKLSITAQGTKFMASHLKQSPAIKELALYNNVATCDNGLLHIAEALQTNYSLVKLSLLDMKLHHTELNGSVLSEMFKTNRSLTYLDLSKNSMLFSNFSAAYIFEGLRYNATLVNLNLSYTGITATDPDTAQSLVKMLQENKSLTHLDLSRNDKFSDSGARCIFEGLQHNSTLVNLNLNYTGITGIDPDTGISLTKMLQVNNTLTHLHLSCYEHASESNHIVPCIFQVLEHNTSLLQLYLRGRRITDHDAECIAQVLKTGRYLQILDIAYSGRWYGLSLTSSLGVTTSLKRLYTTTTRDFEQNIDGINKDRVSRGLHPIDIVIV